MPRSLREARVLWALVLRQILRAGAARHVPPKKGDIEGAAMGPLPRGKLAPHENARCYYTMMIIDMVS
jgi:hypothetical protein